MINFTTEDNNFFNHFDLGYVHEIKLTNIYFHTDFLIVSLTNADDFKNGDSKCESMSSKWRNLGELIHHELVTQIDSPLWNPF